MKPFAAVFAAGTMAVLGSNVAMATNMSLTQFKPRILPVLVQVDAQGHATKVLPAVELPPAMQRMLVENINQWIVGPATIKKQPVGTAVIMNVALRAVHRKDGRYDASFAYVSALPSPYGSAAHWSMQDGDQLALVSDSAGHGSRRYVYRRYMPPPVRPFQPAWRPLVQTTSSHVPPMKPAARTH